MPQLHWANETNGGIGLLGHGFVSRKLDNAHTDGLGHFNEIKLMVTPHESRIQPLLRVNDERLINRLG